MAYCINDDQYLLPTIKQKVRCEIGSATGIRFVTSKGEMKINAGESFEVPFENTKFEEVEGMNNETTK